MARSLFRGIGVLVIAAGLAPIAAAGTPVTWDAASSVAGVELQESWRYRSGDDPAWAAVEVDDADWEVLATPSLVGNAMPATGWTGIGWFRMHLDVDASAVNRPLALEIFHLGASNVFVDGERIGGWGTVAATTADEQTMQPRGRPIPLTFREAGPHVLAIRYSNALSAPGSSWTADWLGASTLSLGYFARLRTIPRSVETIIVSRSGAGFSLGAFALMAALALIHLLLYAFNRSERGNLFYGLFAAGSAVLVLVNFFRNQGTYGLDVMLGFLLANRIIFPILLVTFWTFLYASYGTRIPKYVPLAGLLWIATNVTSFLVPAAATVANGVSLAISVVVATDGLRVMVQAIRRRVTGSLIVGIGVACFSLLTLRELLRVVLGTPYFTTDGLVEPVALIGLILSVSIALARNVGRTHHALEEQLVQVQALSEAQIAQERREADLRIEQEHERARVEALEAENRRAAAELEEARQLQLSLLPTTLPEVAGLSVAAFMRPATEVGGDYYDFAVGDDGALTVAVGDATGHGLRAGSLVTATKSLFVAYADEPDLGRMLSRTTKALKQLRLQRLYMALTVAKLDGRKLRVASAGMPPTYVFRAATSEVEEVVIRAMPLGSVVTFPYAEVDVALDRGDAVVFMSDGFPERMNGEREMPGFDRAREVLTAVGHGTAADILDGFVRDGDAWAGDAPQNDDVTFVVVKVEG